MGGIWLANRVSRHTSWRLHIEKHCAYAGWYFIPIGSVSTLYQDWRNDADSLTMS